MGNYYLKRKFSFQGRCDFMWYGMNRRSINSGKKIDDKQAHYLNLGVELRLTREQWQSFCNQNRQLIESILLDGKIPSIDRVDSSGHYEIGNIRIIDKWTNSLSGGMTNQKRNGKPVVMKDRSGVVVKKYPSRSSVAKDGYKPALVWQSIQRRVRHGGYYWGWAD